MEYITKSAYKAVSINVRLKQLKYMVKIFNKFEDLLKMFYT